MAVHGADVGVDIPPPIPGITAAPRVDGSSVEVRELRRRQADDPDA